jgi:hypothetical protein
MSSDQELQQLVLKQAAELETHRAAATRATIDSALLEAVAKIDVHPGTQGQLVELLRGGAQIINDSDGKPVVMGPGLKPVAQWVQETVSQPTYEHFRRSGSSAAPSLESYASPPRPGGIADLNPAPKNFGEAIVGWAQANKPNQSDPRLNLNVGMMRGVRK